MARRPVWHHMLLDSREEALTAVELHNGPRSGRPLEGFGRTEGSGLKALTA